MPFFQVLFTLIRTLGRKNVNLLLSETLRSTDFFCARSRIFFCSFFGLNFFSSVSSFFHPVTKSVSVDCFMVPLVLKLVCYCKIGTFSELVCEQLFFLFQQKSCFSLLFIGIEKFFALTRIAYDSVSDIKSKNSNAVTPWTFPKRLLAFISPDYRSRISKQGWNFLFSCKKHFFTKKELLQSQSLTLSNEWLQFF